MNQNVYVQKKQTENTQEYPYQERACKNTEKAFVSAARKKKKKREKWKRKNIKTNLLLSKVNSSGQTINRELHGTQLDRGLTMTWSLS